MDAGVDMKTVGHHKQPVPEEQKSKMQVPEHRLMPVQGMAVELHTVDRPAMEAAEA